MIFTTDEQRALHALRVSGRRLVRTSGGWRVHAGGDARTRALARLDPTSTARLLAAGRLRHTDGGGLVLAASAPEQHEAAPSARPAGPPDCAFHIAAAPRFARGAGFLGLARQAERGEGPLSRRGVHAGLLLIKDAEAATRQSGLVMDWAGVPRDRDVRRTWRGGGVDAGARARASLARLRSRTGEGDFVLSWSACVDARSLKWLARRYCLRPASAGARLSAALEHLADAYES